MKLNQGFTLIELMIVVAIIGILASAAVPQYGQYVERSRLVEPMAMLTQIKQHVNSYYLQEREFPENNSEAGLPEPGKLIGNSMTGIFVESGAIHVHLGNKIGAALDGKILTLRPAAVNDSPASPISWLCGYDTPVEGMHAVGENKTTIDPLKLPKNCRARK